MNTWEVWTKDEHGIRVIAVFFNDADAVKFITNDAVSPWDYEIIEAR